MESNIKGLVAAGHEMASELKAECGAVDMRSVAKLISDLATQLEVQLVRANALAEDHQKAIESIKQADVAQAIENLKQKLVECNRYNYCADAVKGVEDACRAAMLHSAEPASNHEELPLDYLQGQKDGLEWAAQLAEANHPQTGDWLYDDPLELAKAIRKGPDMPEFDGPTPVTPDGWISCSERMPAQDDWILIYSKHGEYMAGQVQEEYVELSDGTLSWLGNALFWMPLPEPPQEAK
ncbi:DUF551 domain-containing protein [Escherichia coli]|uniref:DUF551 domain-containing protein n=1 Tax=Escherichia coli TaxID=562 RepID=UPI00273F29E4|nr:DUF551 domain-containing protein [Escherichia coli]